MPSITVTTHCLTRKSPEIIWTQITNAVMTYPKPWCFHVGVPLPQKCELTAMQGNVGVSRRCTSDRGAIEQQITIYKPYSELAFHMVSHNLRLHFQILHMQDHFAIECQPQGLHHINRTTGIDIPKGWGYVMRKWLIAQSVRNVHRYVYKNISNAQTSSGMES